jgi:hypothetical protein
MNDYRHLQRQCELQAALAATPGAREALQEMATEYRNRAEYEERQHPEPNPPALR